MSKRVVQAGFTIVELLIVVVVIAILAAITIVAYNGIQNRTKASATQTTVAQAAKKIAAYAVTNNETFPSDKTAFLTATSLSDSNGVTYDYYASTDGKNYCVSATRADDSSGKFSYASTSRLGSSVPGRCTLNYARTPSPVGGVGPWTGYNGAGGSTPSFTADALDGRSAYRWTTSAAGFAGSTTVGLEYTGNGIAVPASATIAPSIMVRASKAGTYRIMQFFLTSGGTNLGDIYGPSQAVTANTWTELMNAAPLTVPATADRMSIRAQYLSGSTWVSGDWIEVTKVSTSAAQYAYGDALADGWFWMGAANSSASVGPAIVE